MHVELVIVWGKLFANFVFFFAFANVGWHLMFAILIISLFYFFFIYVLHRTQKRVLYGT